MKLGSEATQAVPPGLPSVIHNCLPAVGSLSTKNGAPPTAVSDDSVPPGLRLATVTVPAEVPSLRHSSVAFWPSLAVKYSVPATLTKFAG